jgi:fumarate hydratase subunit alpha
MRKVEVSLVRDEVKRLFIEANRVLPCDVEKLLGASVKTETDPLARSVLDNLMENCALARQTSVPICQDTGMAIVFIELGQQVALVEGLLYDAVNEGVRLAYEEGYLRKSVVNDPIKRVNTGNNTPAIIHLTLTAGDKIKLTCAPKGFGSENMSAIKMFTPSASRQDIIDFVTNTTVKAGSNPCPPVIVGVGIGGSFEYCAYLAKKALTRDFLKPNPDEYYRELERDMLQSINKTGIGPQGFGGDTTALAVTIEHYPTHIAGLPVAVNMSCHVTRHAESTI